MIAVVAPAEVLADAAVLVDVARGSSGSGRAMSLKTGDSSWLCWTKPVVTRQNQLVGRDADGREVEAARPPSAMDRFKDGEQHRHVAGDSGGL